MQQTAVDPTTGTIDMDLIQTGISAGDRVARSHLTTELQALIESASLLLLSYARRSQCEVPYAVACCVLVDDQASAMCCGSHRCCAAVQMQRASCQ